MIVNYTTPAKSPLSKRNEGSLTTRAHVCARKLTPLKKRAHFCARIRASLEAIT